MKVIITYGKNHEVGTWMMALGKNPSRWLLSAFPSLGPVDVNALVSAQGIPCWPPTALNVSFVCAVIVCGFLGTVNICNHCIHSVGSNGWTSLYDSEGVNAWLGWKTLHCGIFLCFVAKEKEPPAFQTLRSCDSHRCTHTHMQTCSALWMLNFNLSWTFVIPLTCAEQI